MSRFVVHFLIEHRCASNHGNTHYNPGRNLPGICLVPDEEIDEFDSVERHWGL